MDRSARRSGTFIAWAASAVNSFSASARLFIFQAASRRAWKRLSEVGGASTCSYLRDDPGETATVPGGDQPADSVWLGNWDDYTPAMSTSGRT